MKFLFRYISLHHCEAVISHTKPYESSRNVPPLTTPLIVTSFANSTGCYVSVDHGGTSSVCYVQPVICTVFYCVECTNVILKDAMAKKDHWSKRLNQLEKENLLSLRNSLMCQGALFMKISAESKENQAQVTKEVQPKIGKFLFEFISCGKFVLKNIFGIFLAMKIYSCARFTCL